MQNDLNIDMLSPLDNLLTEITKFQFNPETEQNQIGLSGLRSDSNNVFDIELFKDNEIKEIEAFTFGGNK